MRNIITIILCLSVPFIAFAQKKYTISGYVLDKKTGEALIGATVAENNLFKGTNTNGYGFYSLQLSEGEHQLTYSYLGFENISLTVNLSGNIKNDIELPEIATSLEQVTVSAESNHRTVNVNIFNEERLSVKEIMKIPSVFGESDVIKAIQLQSGVKTIGDGSSGMFIRGGGSDQNLILIDEAPIYNPSHLFGLVSVFNPDALNNVSLYKSNMPAQYGGRASSVIDCKMKEGNLKEYDFAAGISPFSSIITVNGPIIKEKSAFFISARKSLVDFFVEAGPNMPIVPAFYDLNLKLNTKIGSKDRLFFSLYKGADRLESAEGFYNKWGNTTFTLRWNRNIGTKLFSNVSFISSNYENYLEFKDEGKDYKWLTGLKDLNAKVDLTYYIQPDNLVKFGIESIYHKFTPGETTDTMQSIPRVQAFEYSAYLLNDIKPFNWMGINYGIRVSFFQDTGETTWFQYDESHLPISKHKNVSGAYKSYFSIEPRISFNLKLNTSSSFKLAFARNAQNLQVLQNNSLSYASLETWFPSNQNIKPLIANVVSVGWFYNISDAYSFSLESYYKTYSNQIDYVDHASLVNNPYIEGEIRTGSAKAYGIEFLLKKETGKLTGSLSYSYSRALRKIEGINNNEEYNSPYDIPHDFRITGNYQVTSKWNASAVWMYTSGRPVTLPVGFYYEDDEPIPIYSDRNSSRFPDYHRLDLATTYCTEANPSKSFWTISLGVFNAYAHKNPLGYEFVRRHNSENVDVYQYSLFTILPNFSVKFNF
jgi:hypothetical protein